MLGFNPLYAAVMGLMGPQPTVSFDFLNNKYLPSSLSFSRASNATKFDSSGRLTWAPHNLYTYANQLTSVSVFRGTVVADVSGPIAGTTMYNMTEDTTNNTHVLLNSASFSGGVPYIFSVVAKANGRNRIELDLASTAFGVTSGATFDLSTGQVVSTFGTATAGVINLGNGFYRVYVQKTAVNSNASNCMVYLDNGSVVTYLGDGASGVLLGAVQVEAVPFWQTAPSPFVYDPVTPSSPCFCPRFDCSPTTGADRGLLMEEQRTNLITYSHANQFGCTAANASYTNNVPDPRGFGYVVTSTANGTSGQHYTYGGSLGSVAVSTLYTVSAIVVSSTNDLIQLTPSSAWCDASNIYVNFQFSTGTVIGKGTGVISTFIEPLGGGAYRVAFSFNSSATATVGAGCIFGHISAAADGRFPTNTLTNTIVAGAVQAEAGGYPTSYIPTYGVAATRASDACSMSLGSSVPYPCSLVVDAAIQLIPTTIYPSLVGLTDGTGLNRLLTFAAYNGTNWGSAVRVDDAGVQQVNTTGPQNAAPFTSKRSAIRFAVNDTKVYSGGAFFSDTTCTMPVGINSMRLGGSVSVTDCVRWLRKVNLYNIGLTDQQLNDMSA